LRIHVSGAREKGKLDKPVKFGRTLQLIQDGSGVIVHYEIHRGNPSDKTDLVSLVRQTKKILKQALRELATDHRSRLKPILSTVLFQRELIMKTHLLDLLDCLHSRESILSLIVNNKNRKKYLFWNSTTCNHSKV
jgi:hypothetical protein